jgi:hypothetical protein
MSSKFEKMKNYDTSRRGKFGFTSSQFGKVGRNIDKESEKPKLIQEKFVNRPKVEQSEQPSTSKELRDEMDKIEEDQEKDVDRDDFKRSDAPPTVRRAPAKTEDELITKHKAGGAFIKAWTVVDHIVVPPTIEPKKSSYLPNFISASIILRAMEMCLDGNERLRKISPNFFFLPIRLYYSVIYYIQILKAKEAANKLGKSEGTWFRNFKRNYPLESLPIVGPMVPYFANIVSVKPNDDKYDFIYPTFKTNGGLSVARGIPSVTTEYYLQPNVLMQAEFLRQFCTISSADLTGKIDNEYRYFDDTNALIPHRIGAAFRFAGIEFNENLTVPTSSVLSNVALDRALPEGKERCLAIHDYWRKSLTSDIPRAETECDYNYIGDAMRMSEDLEWFEECIHMASIHCKFFSDSTNLSQIPSTGGSEVLVTAHITGRDEKYKAAESWYPLHWKNLMAKFQTTRADTGPDQFLNAEYALSNATISWSANGHPIGGRQSGHRTGPYWQNRQFEYQLDTAAPVARRMATMIRSQFYDWKGDAS